MMLLCRRDFNSARRINEIILFQFKVRIWDAKEHKELSVFDRNVHQAPITCLAWHPNGNLLATGAHMPY